MTSETVVVADGRHGDILLAVSYQVDDDVLNEVAAAARSLDSLVAVTANCCD